MKTLAAIAVLLLTMAPAQAQTTNLTGKWTGTLTRTAPDGRTQSIDFMFDLTQKAKVLTGTAGPNAERQWAILKGGAVNGSKVTFQVQQPDGGPLRTFTLALVKAAFRARCSPSSKTSRSPRRSTPGAPKRNRWRAEQALFFVRFLPSVPSHVCAASETAVNEGCDC